MVRQYSQPNVQAAIQWVKMLLDLTFKVFLKDGMEMTDHIKQWILDYHQALQRQMIIAAEVAATVRKPMQIFEGQITRQNLDAVIKYITEWTPPAATTATAMAVVDKLAPVAEH